LKSKISSAIAGSLGSNLGGIWGGRVTCEAGELSCSRLNIQVSVYALLCITCANPAMNHGRSALRPRGSSISSTCHQILHLCRQTTGDPIPIAMANSELRKSLDDCVRKIFSARARVLQKAQIPSHYR
jgi:hypothetical protein